MAEDPLEKIFAVRGERQGKSGKKKVVSTQTAQCISGLILIITAVLKKSSEGKDSTTLSKLAVVGKIIRGFKIYFLNFLLLHQLSSFV